MTEPRPVYTTQTDDSVELVPAGYADLTLAYRGAVSAALQLQRALHLAPGERHVLERDERAAYRKWRETE